MAVGGEIDGTALVDGDRRHCLGRRRTQGTALVDAAGKAIELRVAAGLRDESARVAIPPEIEGYRLSG